MGLEVCLAAGAEGSHEPRGIGSRYVQKRARPWRGHLCGAGRLYALVRWGRDTVDDVVLLVQPGEAVRTPARRIGRRCPLPSL